MLCVPALFERKHSAVIAANVTAVFNVLDNPQIALFLEGSGPPSNDLIHGTWGSP